jgi:hypothetical protein
MHRRRRTTRALHAASHIVRAQETQKGEARDSARSPRKLRTKRDAYRMKSDEVLSRNMYEYLEAIRSAVPILYLVSLSYLISK